MQLLKLILTPLVFIAAVAHADQSENVKQLDFKNFKKSVSNNEIWLVKFYADWCGHCQAMSPAWSELADFYASSSINGKRVNIAEINCTSKNILCNKFDVSGYPTIKIFHDLNENIMNRDIKDIQSTEVEVGERSVNNYKNYIKKITNDVTTANSKAEFDAMYSLNTPTFILLNADQNTPIVHQFKIIARKNKFNFDFFLANGDEFYDLLSTNNELHINHLTAPTEEVNTSSKTRLFMISKDLLTEFAGDVSNKTSVALWMDYTLRSNIKLDIDISEEQVQAGIKAGRKLVMTVENTIFKMFGMDKLGRQLIPLANYLTYPEAINDDFKEIEHLKGKFNFAVNHYSPKHADTLYQYVRGYQMGIFVWSLDKSPYEYYYFDNEAYNTLKTEYGLVGSKDLFGEKTNSFQEGNINSSEMAIFLRAIDEGKLAPRGISLSDQIHIEYRIVKLKYNALVATIIGHIWIIVTAISIILSIFMYAFVKPWFLKKYGDSISTKFTRKADSKSTNNDKQD